MGSVLDTQIRDMEQKGQVRQGQLTSHVMDSPYSGHNIVDSPEKSDKRAKGKKFSMAPLGVARAEAVLLIQSNEYTVNLELSNLQDWPADMPARGNATHAQKITIPDQMKQKLCIAMHVCRHATPAADIMGSGHSKCAGSLNR